eukprot:TRINITY_DN17944_c0_g1_i1.p1 TRINITY_DN17944_c0_g1~~TRINITY_DN17944_c0_g1_i1.p1  ORF type:complete len:260 (-),score=78.43 TRINITY_DN17944_c0_g1_i1:44-796(-)
MAVGKNKRLSKKGKGLKKKIVDPYTKKEWYDIKAPNMFSERQVGKTIVSRTQGTKIAAEALKGRVFEVCLADLQKTEDQSFRKIKLRAEEVSGRNLLTNFYGLDFTTDKVRSLVKKWQSLIEMHVDVKTTDGHVLRVFTIAFTKKRPNTTRKTCYASTAQKKAIRKKMVDIITAHVTTVDLKDVVKKLIPEVIGKEIEKSCQGIYPLQNVFVRKVKLLKSPKFDIAKLLELHADTGAAETGTKVAAPASA